MDDKTNLMEITYAFHDFDLLKKINDLHGKLHVHEQRPFGAKKESVSLCETSLFLSSTSAHIYAISSSDECSAN